MNTWYLTLLLNWIIAGAYFAIPWGLHRRGYLGLQGTESLVFQVFIAACGLHHLLHPLAMRYNWWLPTLSVDAMTAAASVVAAVLVLRRPVVP